MSSDTVELWRRMAGRVGEGSRPRFAGAELGMEARDCQVHAPPSEDRADLDTQLCCHAAAMLAQQPRTESAQCTSGDQSSLQQTLPAGLLLPCPGSGLSPFWSE